MGMTALKKIDPKRSQQWVAEALEALQHDGYFVVEHTLGDKQLAAIREAMYRAQAAIHAEVGRERLNRAGERGVLRLMGKFEPSLFQLLEIPEVLALIDATVSPAAIMHVQNGFILPSTGAVAPAIFQTSFHRDFPRHLNGYVASINVFFAIDPFTVANGATVVIPGSQQKADQPSLEEIGRNQVALECDAGAMIVFDSTLWHAAGANTSGRDRLAVNHQFTRSWIKQQIDYIRALGEQAVLRLPPRTQQLLGYYTRVVTSLDEYYQPEERRLYRKGQG